MKKLIILFLIIINLFAYKKIIYPSYISKLTFNKKYLIAGLENGEIIIKNFKTLKNINTIILPKIHDFMDELIPMPIYSLDISPENNNLLILAQGENAFKIIYLYNFKTKKLTKIFSTKENLIEAKYISKNKILIGTLADEAILFDLKLKKEIYHKQIGNYVFSLFVLNKDKNLAAFGDESGIVTIIDIKNGKTVKTVKGFNKGKTLTLDFKKYLILNASEDRKVSIYNLKYDNFTVENNVKFLPYAAGISPNLKYYAIQYNEKNNIAIFDMNNKLIQTLKGHTMALNGLKFIKNNEIISFSPAEIIIWKLKENK
ncbi:nitrate reductase [Lebetimonas sp. JS138]|uniref:nitrate reductase n=1 Tax=Lebetimonas sp. JS138 TaxID=990072 RepID=UPI000464B382|nr:nitrate reductase [Lebetimonas sp. JS138]